jgi:hypothetical protein
MPSSSIDSCADVSRTVPSAGDGQSRQLHADLALPREVEHWSLTTIREKLVKIGAEVVAHGRYVTFQMAEVAVLRDLFRDILRRIDRLRRLIPTTA